LNNGKYVYCFIEGRFTEQINIMGMGNHGQVYFISFDGITAAVCDTPLIKYDPSRKNAIIHANTIHELMKYCNLVPCSFGSVFKSRDDLITFMKEAYQYILENLQKVKDKIEVGLRVFWKKATFSEEFETKEIKELRDSISSEAGSNTYLSQMELGKMVEEQVNNRREVYIESIYKPIAHSAVDAKLNEQSNPLMVFNAAFLVWKHKEEEFDILVGKYIDRYADKFDFSYSGPWPVYNFTDSLPEA
jgi:hypothetical protein